MIMCTKRTKACKVAAIGLLLLTSATVSAIPFDIDVTTDFTGTTLTLTQQTVFTSALNQAATTWDSIITGYQSLSVPAGFQLDISAKSPYIDGSGGILGQSGPTTIWHYGNFAYSSNGLMQFDSADVANLIINNSLYGVMLHEMAHVIGFGALWDTTKFWTDTQRVYTAGSGQYTGAKALSEWQIEFAGQASATYVPVELGGGPGTANGHWNEVNGGSSPTGIVRNSDGKDMARELMTGWLNTPTFISQTTVCSFQDIGYTTTGTCGISSVPEPVSLSLFGLGLAGLSLTRRRKLRLV